MIERVLVLPLNYDHLQNGMVDGFKQVFGDANVRVIDYLAMQKNLQDSAVYADVEFMEIVERMTIFKDWIPDWIFMQLQETNVISARTILHIKSMLPKTFITQWNGDYRPQLGDYQQSIARAVDKTFLSSRGQLKDYTLAGAKDVSYCQIGLDWNEDVIGLPAWTPPFQVPEVVFIGNYYANGPWTKGTKERLNIVRMLHAAFPGRFGVVGAGWPEGVPVVGTCIVKQQHHVWKRAKVCVNVNHENDVELYYSDRLLIAMASGTPVVTRYVPGLEREFSGDLDTDDPADCLWFSSAAFCVSAVKLLLDNPVLAAEIGARGRYTVMRDHSWFTRVINMRAELEEVIL